MIGLYVALTLLLLMVNMVSIMYALGGFRVFLAMVWKRVTKPSMPPWMRNGLEKNHERTAKNHRNSLHPRICMSP